MAVSAVMERIGKLIPNPDPAIQKRMERTQPLRAELIGTIRVVWAVVLAGLVAFRFWMGIHFLDFFLGVAFPAFWLLGTWSKNKPFAGAALLVSVVFGTMFFTPIQQSEGLVILTILLAGLAVGEFFVGIWTFVCAVAFPFALSDSRAWQVNAGWSAVYV
ncbi:MAG: hypothetical protein JO307_14845, partial [Bryobacterales bacterium]|nr:hypothetical protein [Bryobacterales bacterium]